MVDIRKQIPFLSEDDSDPVFEQVQWWYVTSIFGGLYGATSVLERLGAITQEPITQFLSSNISFITVDLLLIVLLFVYVIQLYTTVSGEDGE